MLQMSSKNDQKYKIYFKIKMDNNKNDRKQHKGTEKRKTVHCHKYRQYNLWIGIIVEWWKDNDNCNVDDCDDDDFEDGD